jgi:hypothetical protein
MAETPNDKPKNPNIQRPAQPSNNMQKDKGLAELNKKLEAVKAETKEAKESAEKNTDKVIKALEKNTEETKPKKKTAEELSEGKNRDKKFLESLRGMFDGIKKGLTGATSGIDLKPLLAVWTFFKKLAKMALIFGVGGILANIKLEDIKKIWEGMKNVFGKMKTFFTPIIKELAIWFEEKALPLTVELLLKTFDNIGQLFENLSKEFEGWTKTDWKGKMMMVLGGIGVIGDFITEFAGDVTDWFFNLLGYDGSVTTDVKNHIKNVFGPEMTDAIISIMSWTAGLFMVSKIFGPKWITGPLWIGAKSLLRNSIGRLALSIMSTMSLYAWYYGGLMLAALSPYGWAIAATAIIATLAVVYYDEIKEATKTVFKALVDVLKNASIWVNNTLADTAFGKWLGLEKMGENRVGSELD